MKWQQQRIQHIRYGLTPLPFGTLLPMVATSYMLGTVNWMHKLRVQISEKDIIGMPKTLEEIKAMQPFEFQNWVCEKLLARASRRMVGDFGIDGWLIDGRPLQVKQSENIGRNVVDNFETAIRRVNKDKGIIVAFSFSRGTYEEVARAKLHEGLEIGLKTAEEILREE